MAGIAVAFNGQAFTIALNHQVDSVRAYLPLRSYLVAAGFKASHQLALERGLGFLLFLGLLQRPHEMAGIVGVLNQLPPQIALFKIALRGEGMDNPHLVPCPAGGDVEALLEYLLIA